MNEMQLTKQIDEALAVAAQAQRDGDSVLERFAITSAQSAQASLRVLRANAQAWDNRRARIDAQDAR